MSFLPDNSHIVKRIGKLTERIEGEIFTDSVYRIIYATDASPYKEYPLAVAYPKTEKDIVELIRFARENKSFLIPRTAGTSLAGQVVGEGIVADVSKHMTQIIEFNKEKKYIRVQPGVVLDELNNFLKPHGLFFGPETSTSNRCMIGGMVGNNACGSHSLIYGSTRDHVISLKTILSDGSIAEFNNLSEQEFKSKLEKKSFEGDIYNKTFELLSPRNVIEEINKEFPDDKITRRNNGYAIDLLVKSAPFNKDGNDFNFCSLLAGSEGTLAFITEITLNLIPLPSPEKGIICAHFFTLEDALHANLIALKHNPGAVELIDNIILDCTKTSIEQSKNRSFIKDNPGAVLIIEFACDTKEELHIIRDNVEYDMRDAGLGYHFPLITGEDINKVWALRKAGLGLLSNIAGDAKAVSVIEDTAVAPELLPEYIADFKQILEKYHLSCVFHAHIGSGELHLRPVLNLKIKEHVDLFRTLAYEIAYLVKRYKGSLSGEHGDGRLRGELIPIMVGEKNYEILKKIKQIWDPQGVFNRNKIVETPQMNTSLRFSPKRPTKQLKTYFRFPEKGGMLEHIERCNGSSDCRKSSEIGGLMCPSFMATRDETAVTRARANILREFIVNSTRENPLSHKEIFEVLDLCISCKGCKLECPSNIDMAKLKAEFLQHYYNKHGVPLRSWLIANITRLNSIGEYMPVIYNMLLSKKNIVSTTFKKVLGFSEHRNLPLLNKVTLRKWAKKNLSELNSGLPGDAPAFVLFVDEFSNYYELETGISFIKLFNKLGYKMEIAPITESGRTFISKGLIKKAKSIARDNIIMLNDIVKSDMPLVGIEPSALLTIKDEYPELAYDVYTAMAEQVAKNTYLFDEFIASEIDKGRIKSESFTTESKAILLHGHCQQKAVISTKYCIKALSLPANFKVTEIQSGCCGMAGSFGYEREHYELSNRIGEMHLFSAVRDADSEIVISAPGTSCRHHIKDNTNKSAYHPIDILYQALKK